MSTNEQKEPWFLEINPNGRIPALTDKWTDGSDIRVFESGAILQYLVDRYDKDHKVSYPRDSKETWEVNSWVSFYLVGSCCVQQRTEWLILCTFSFTGRWVVWVPCRDRQIISTVRFSLSLSL